VQNDELAQHRARLDHLVSLAREDDTVLERLRRDPVAALGTLGVSKEMMGDVLREEGYGALDPDDPILTAKQRNGVRQARWCEGCCLTCIFSECPITRL
jgi:hypothetical protein